MDATMVVTAKGRDGRDEGEEENDGESETHSREEISRGMEK